VLLAEYRIYLEQERAATAGTVVNFTRYAGIFLRTFPRLGTDAAQQAGLAAALGRLTAAEAVTFVTGWASCRSPAYGQVPWPVTGSGPLRGVDTFRWWLTRHGRCRARCSGQVRGRGPALPGSRRMRWPLP
jgi:hypothetical protein